MPWRACFSTCGDLRVGQWPTPHQCGIQDGASVDLTNAAPMRHAEQGGADWTNAALMRHDRRPRVRAYQMPHRCGMVAETALLRCSREKAESVRAQDAASVRHPRAHPADHLQDLQPAPTSENREWSLAEPVNSPHTYWSSLRCRFATSRMRSVERLFRHHRQGFPGMEPFRRDGGPAGG